MLQMFAAPVLRVRDASIMVSTLSGWDEIDERRTFRWLVWFKLMRVKLRSSFKQKVDCDLCRSSPGRLTPSTGSHCWSKTDKLLLLEFKYAEANEYEWKQSRGWVSCDKLVRSVLGRVSFCLKGLNIEKNRLVSELVSAADGGKLRSWFSDDSKLTEEVRFNVDADFWRCSLNVGGTRRCCCCWLWLVSFSGFASMSCEKTFLVSGSKLMSSSSLSSLGSNLT